MDSIEERRRQAILRRQQSRVFEPNGRFEYQPPRPVTGAVPHPDLPPAPPGQRKNI